MAMPLSRLRYWIDRSIVSMTGNPYIRQPAMVAQEDQAAVVPLEVREVEYPLVYIQLQDTLGKIASKIRQSSVRYRGHLRVLVIFGVRSRAVPVWSLAQNHRLQQFSHSRLLVPDTTAASRSADPSIEPSYSRRCSDPVGFPEFHLAIRSTGCRSPGPPRKIWNGEVQE